MSFKEMSKRTSNAEQVQNGLYCLSMLNKGYTLNYLAECFSVSPMTIKNWVLKVNPDYANETKRLTDSDRMKVLDKVEYLAASGVSMTDAVKQCGVSYSTAERWACKFSRQYIFDDVVRKNSKDYILNQGDLCIKMYNNGMSVKDLATHFNVSDSTIRNWISSSDTSIFTPNKSYSNKERQDLLSIVLKDCESGTSFKSACKKVNVSDSSIKSWAYSEGKSDLLNKYITVRSAKGDSIYMGILDDVIQFKKHGNSWDDVAVKFSVRKGIILKVLRKHRSEDLDSLLEKPRLSTSDLGVLGDKVLDALEYGLNPYRVRKLLKLSNSKYERIVKYLSE